jgi:Tol biopolymer transport system component/tRNA A-37 threonylcarbamoyl transferase component Bud32
MALSVGDRLGPYEILAPIGAGGMGEVYKARDTRLDRSVAIKVALENFFERFEREARTIAALNHPHICQLYDVGPNYLVMEYVEGTPLKGPLPLEKAVECASQLLDALGAAHKNGITHRDLKPANILITKSGIKLLDFGLAKQTGPLKETDATKALTVQGEILGTLQYMSPEQLQGKEVDARSDLFSFGCVLYELVTSKRAFEGTSAASVIAAILEREPEPLRTTPPLDRIIRRCLQKDPDDRFQTARDLKYNLGLAIEVTTLVGPTVTSRDRLAWVLFAAMGMIAVGALLYAFRATNSTAPETRVDIVTPATNAPRSFALSPDGRRIAYVASGDGASRLWVRPLDSTLAQPLQGTDGAVNPFWSPDSRSLGFFVGGKLERVDLGGGQPQTLAEVVTPAPQGAWSAEGVILFNSSTSGPLSRITAAGGQVVAATKLGQGQIIHRAPRFLPGGRKFLFIANGTEQAIWLGSLDGTAPRRLIAVTAGTESEGEYLAPGWMVRVRQGALVAQRFNFGRGQLSGDPILLAQAVGADQLTKAGSFSVSTSGTIAWRTGGGSRRQLIWFNRSGQNVGAFGAPDESGLFNSELSPDGQRAAINRGPASEVSGEIWIADGTRTSRLTFDRADDRYPIWSPDSARLVFSSNRNGESDLYQKAASGSGGEQALLRSAETKRPNSWSPDGRFILYWSRQNNGDLMVLPLFGDRKPFPFLSTPFDERQGVFSPDGRWVAYQSNESGRFEVYVRTFPGTGGPWQVSTGGGNSPRWRADAKELYYLGPDDKLMGVAVAAQGATLVPGTPEVLFQTHIVQGADRQQYDVSRDGRFLVNTELSDTSTEPIHLLLNWKPPDN